MSETWLLFEDASHDAVQCTLYPLPKDYPRPVDAYIVFEHSGDFTIAVQKAVHAVFALARNRNITVRPVNAGFDLSRKTHLNAGMAGQSGGLCFALAFAKKLLNLDLPDLAATGIISSDGRISPVNGIETKLRTACTLLNENDLILFPKDNESQIPDSLITRIKHKNIRLHPVTTLDQAMDILTENTDPGSSSEKPTPKPWLPAVLIFILVAICLFAGFHIFGKKPTPQEIPQTPEPISQEIPIPQKKKNTPPVIKNQNAGDFLDSTSDMPDLEPHEIDHKGFD